MDMDNPDRLKKNFEFIAENTTNFGKLLALLFQNEIIDTREREELESGKTQYDRNTAFYLLVMKKCPFEILLNCLEGSSNKHIADKLRSVEGNDGSVNTSSASVTTSQNVFTDFVVEVKHIKFISKILNEEVDQEIWDEVKTLWLTQKMRNDVGMKNSMKLDILGCLNGWIGGTAKEERLYSKIVEHFEDYPRVKEKLIQDSWMGAS